MDKELKVIHSVNFEQHSPPARRIVIDVIDPTFKSFEQFNAHGLEELKLAIEELVQAVTCISFEEEV